jgi:hypothetical protein
VTTYDPRYPLQRERFRSKRERQRLLTTYAVWASGAVLLIVLWAWALGWWRL